MITFNFKKAKSVKEEKYNFPVLTQLSYLGDKNSVVKFELNKAALDALSYPENLKNCKLSVGLVDNMLVIVNTTGVETEHQFNVNMDGTVNSKFLLNRINKHFEIDKTINNEFKLIINETEGVKYAFLDPNMEIVEEVVTDAIGEPVELEDMTDNFDDEEEDEDWYIGK